MTHERLTDSGSEILADRLCWPSVNICFGSCVYRTSKAITILVAAESHYVQ